MTPSFRLISWLMLILFVNTDTNADCCAKKRNSAAAAVSSEDLAKFLDSFVPDLMRDEHMPGAALVFVQNGKVVLSKGFGFANLEQKQPVHTDTTIFPIGSISKVFTATALVQLADHNKINLNSDVNSYLKKMKVPDTYPQPITSAHLLSHTSGLDEIRPGTHAKSAKEIQPLHAFL
jgi:CubicO group peptidase (beta-lactamase class C family)